MSKVSVIVPVYNASNYLPDCLNSLLKQTLDDMEIIAIDDASTDQSLSVLEHYQKLYTSKLKIIRHSKNQGLSSSRNDGIAIAQGKYIGFVDSDDFVHPDMYDDLYYAASKTDYPEIVSTGMKDVSENSHFDDIDDTKRQGGKKICIPKNPNYLYWETPSCCNKIFRKDTIPEHPFLEHKIWEDGAFTYSQMVKADYIVSFNNPDYYYRQHSKEGIMASCQRVNQHLLDIFDINDHIKNVAVRHQSYRLFASQIKLIQSASCLQRMLEVYQWNIPEEDKLSIIYDLDTISCHNYGDWRQMNTTLLKSKVDYDQLLALGLVDHKNHLENNPETSKQNIQKQLTLLQKKSH